MTAQDYEAYVYDLDGTLVRLDVDWDVVRDDVAAALSARDVDVGDTGLWGLLELADETELRDLAEERISEHEREGARRSTRLPAADHLPHDVPVGVLSLNCEAACRISLEKYGLDGYVDVVAGRDSYETEKPDPEPLLGVAEALGVAPEQVLFIGDSKRDEETAVAAGTEFIYTADWVDQV